MNLYHKIYHREDLIQTTMPILILVGEKPVLYKDPQAFTAAAAYALPHAKIEIIANTGHDLHIEESSLVNQKMTDFLLENTQ